MKREKKGHRGTKRVLAHRYSQTKTDFRRLKEEKVKKLTDRKKVTEE